MSHAYSVAREANLLGALAVAVVDRMELAVTRATGLSGSAPAALITLDSPAGGTTLSALCAALALSHSGAVRLVDRLMATGLVERRRGRDQRSLELALTPAGRRSVRRIHAARESACDSLLASLTADQRASLTDGQVVLLGRLEERPADTGWICRLCDRRSCRHSSGGCPVESGTLRRSALEERDSGV
jgi:MarR family transcriptional regulator, negative regulator of the multidrug operon emrRAB